MVTQMHLTRGRLNRQRRCRQKVMGAMHAALGGRFLVLLNCHGDTPSKILKPANTEYRHNTDKDAGSDESASILLQFDYFNRTSFANGEVAAFPSSCSGSVQDT